MVSLRVVRSRAITVGIVSTFARDQGWAMKSMKHSPRNPPKCYYERFESSVQ